MLSILSKLNPMKLFDWIRPTNKRDQARIDIDKTEQSFVHRHSFDKMTEDSFSSARSMQFPDWLNRIVRPQIALSAWYFYLFIRYIEIVERGVAEFNKSDYVILGSIITFYFGGRVYHYFEKEKKQISVPISSIKEKESIVTKELTVSISKILVRSRKGLEHFTAAVMLTESAGDLYAKRFERHVFKQGKSKEQATSWGLFQIMGYNLEILGLDLNRLPEFLNDLELQIEYFYKYYDKFLAGKSNNPEELYALYNGGPKALKYKKDHGYYTQQITNHVANFRKNLLKVIEVDQ